jgi:hypothetical protein
VLRVTFFPHLYVILGQEHGLSRTKCSEQNTNGPKLDDNVLLEEAARNVCCSPETDGTINPFSATHEIRRMEILAVWFGLFYYLIFMKEMGLSPRSCSVITAWTY